MDLAKIVPAYIGELFVPTAFEKHTRIRTPFLFPDGDYIDVYVQEQHNTFVVTDFAETSRWLRMQSAALRRSPKQNELIQDVCLTHGVEWFRGALIARVSSLDDVPAASLRVAQASLRISDLWFTMRQRLTESRNDDVAEMFSENGVSFTRNETLTGRSQKPWRVDFHTFGRGRSHLVEVLSTGSRAAGQAMLKHVVTLWHDLSYVKMSASPVGFVTLFDDEVDVWSENDFKLVEDLSHVQFLSHPEEFIELVAA